MRIAIIGAGLSGLVLASRLAEAHQVTVFEKARGPGGRMSTRRADPYAFDHGAQYFTAQTDRFQDFLAPYLESGLVKPWDVEMATVGEARLSDKPKYIAVPGMNALCKSLASGVSVRSQVHVETLHKQDGMWWLEDKSGQREGPFDWVISTAPSVQTQALFPADFEGQKQLEQVEMMGCFSLMLGFEQAVDLPWAVIKSGSPPIGWMALNSAKPGRPEPSALLIQSDNAWAEQHLEDDSEAVTRELLAAASELSGRDLSQAPHQVLHRWRYAATSKPVGQAYLIDEAEQLAACGDWCLGGKVEAAFTSASALADLFVTSSRS